MCSLFIKHLTISGEDFSLQEVIILSDNVQREKKNSGSRPKSIVWIHILNKIKRYLKVIIKAPVYIVIPFSIKVHLKF